MTVLDDALTRLAAGLASSVATLAEELRESQRRNAALARRPSPGRLDLDLLTRATTHARRAPMANPVLERLDRLHDQLADYEQNILAVQHGAQAADTRILQALERQGQTFLDLDQQIVALLKEIAATAATLRADHDELASRVAELERPTLNIV